MMAVGCAGVACSAGTGTGTTGAGGAGRALNVGCCSGGGTRVGLAPSVSQDGEASGAGMGGGATGWPDCFMAICVLSLSFKMPVNQSGSSPRELVDVGDRGADGGLGAEGAMLYAIVAASSAFAWLGAGIGAWGCCVIPAPVCSGGKMRVALAC